MRLFKLAIAGCVALCLAACSPFKSEHELLLPVDDRSKQHFQSYYIPKTLLTAKIFIVDGKQKDIELGWERIADRSYLFQVNYDRSVVHDDDLYVETNDKGFLTSVQANSVDKTADIVQAATNILLTTVGQFGGGASGVRSLPQGALGVTHLLTVQLDPFDENDLGTSNRMLSAHGYCISMFDRDDQPLPGSCEVWRQRHHSRIETVAYAHRGGKPEVGQGFFYRRPVEHKLIVHRRKGNHWVPIWSGMHRFEQQAEILEIKVDRGAFINLQATLTFDDGVLKKYTLNKPSELLGFMTIPTTVVNAIVQIPGLTVSAYEQKLTLRDRTAAARERELNIRQRELGILVPAAGSAAGDTRSVVYVDPRYTTPSQSTRSAAVLGAGPNVDALAAEKKRAFFERCRDRVELTAKDCEDAWVRSIGQ